MRKNLDDKIFVKLETFEYLKSPHSGVSQPLCERFLHYFLILTVVDNKTIRPSSQQHLYQYICLDESPTGFYWSRRKPNCFFWSGRKPNWVLVCPYFYRVVLLLLLLLSPTVGLSFCDSSPPYL